MLARLASLMFVASVLAACNTGESVFEWDEETTAIMAEREAAAEQSEMDDDEDADSAPALDADVGLVVPMAILRDSGELGAGDLAVAEPTGTSRQATASLDDGDVCSGGLVATDETRGTYAISCESGTIWLGDYIFFFTEDLGAAQMRDQSGNPARMIYGPDVPKEGLDALAFEALWAAREAMAE